MQPVVKAMAAGVPEKTERGSPHGKMYEGTVKEIDLRYGLPTAYNEDYTDNICLTKIFMRMKNKLLLLLLSLFLAFSWQNAYSQTITSTMSAYTFDGNWGLSNLIDKDYTTSFWGNTAQQAGDYIQLDYGEITTVCGISMYFQRNTSGGLWDAPSGTAKIQISENALTWTDVATFTASNIGAAETNNVYSCTANGAAARYVRLYLQSASGESWLRVNEIEVETNCVVVERTVSVESSNTSMGKAYIETEGVTTITATGIVEVTAEANEGYVFVNWTDKATGDEMSTNAVFRYALADDIVLVANFKWDSTVSRTGWTAYADSYHDGTSSTDGPASWAIDDNRETWWHSQYDPTETTYPHWIMFDLGKSQSFTSFNYVSRNGMTTDSGNGNITTYELYVSDNEEDVKNYAASAKVAEGEFEYDGTTRVAVDHVVEIPGGAKGRYVLLKGLASANGEQFAACAEFFLYLDAYTVSAVSADEARGYVYIGEEGVTSISAGLDGTETATLTAVPLEGYEFAGWYKDGALVSSDAVYTTDPITESATYSAEFSFIPVPERSITVVSADSQKGSVRIVDPETDQLTVSSTGIVKVEAIPNGADNEFVNWTDETGAVVSTEAIYSYAKKEAVTLTANFISYYTLTINTADGGQIAVSSESGTVANGDKILEGTSLTVILRPDRLREAVSLKINAQEVFGEYSETDGYTFNITGATSISAVFEMARYELQYEYSGSGYVEVWTSDTYDSDAEAEGTLELPLSPAGSKCPMYSEISYGDYIYIFAVSTGGATLESIVINGDEYVNDENFVLYGDIEYEVPGDVTISARFSGEDLTGVEENVSGNEGVKVYAVEGGINVECAEAVEVSVYSATGVLNSTTNISGSEYIQLQPGLYIVNAAGGSYKVVVR